MIKISKESLSSFCHDKNVVGINWADIRESRIDGCMETLEYYSDLMDSGHKLNEVQLKDYKEKCAILQCMGEEASEYAKVMLNIIE